MTTPSPPSSDTRTASRSALAGWRTWAALAAALTAIYSATGLLREPRTSDSQEPRADISYDAWSTGITSVLYDREGKVEYTLQGIIIGAILGYIMAVVALLVQSML